MSKVADFLVDLFRLGRKTSIVDIGANPIDGEPPYKVMLQGGYCTLIGFEPQAGPFRELEDRKGSNETYLPIAVGDGRRHTLHVTSGGGMSSLLQPDPRRLSMFNGFAAWGRVIQEETVQTRRLDDIAEVENIDLLKIDIQGSELMALRGGSTKLAKAVAIHIEISFVPLYKDQPCFGDIDQQLRGMGFLPHALAAIKRWPIAPVVYDGDARKPMHQLLEADIVYVKDFAHPEGFSDEQLQHLALIADCVYGSSDLTHRCLLALSDRGTVTRGAAAEYLGLRHPGTGNRE